MTPGDSCWRWHKVGAGGSDRCRDRRGRRGKRANVLQAIFVRLHSQRPSVLCRTSAMREARRARPHVPYPFGWMDEAGEATEAGA